MSYLQVAVTALIGYPVGSVVKIPEENSCVAHFYQLTNSGVVTITPAAYCDAINSGG